MRLPTAEERKMKAVRFVPALSHVFCPRVIDGDSIECVAFCDNAKQLYKFSVRVAGVDTPEMRSKNPLEKRAAHAAKAFTELHVLGEELRLEKVSHDKYGRILAYVRTPSGALLHDLLIKSSHGVSYDGGKKKVFK